MSSIIHVSIKPSNKIHLSSTNQENKNNINSRTAHHSCKRLEESTNTIRSVSVIKVHRSLSKSSQNFNNETNSSIKHDRLRTTRVSDQHVLEKLSTNQFNTINSMHRYHRLAKTKKFKNLIKSYRRCIITSIFFLICLGIIIGIILWRLSQTTVNKPFIIAFLRWNPIGITLFGNTSIPGNSSNQFANPFGLVLNSFNDFYIADRNNNRIQKCRAGELACTTIAGKANAVQGTNMSDLNGPTYMYIDSNNNLYIADSGNQRVQFWNYGATYGKTIAGTTGLSGSTLNQFNIPYGIALDSNAVYIADCNNNRIMKYSSNVLTGTVVAGGNGAGTNNTQLNCPAGIYFEASTNSLIIANFRSNNIVRWILGDNKWTNLVGDANGINGNTSTFLDHPTSVIFDPMGNMYIADMFNHRIEMYLVGQSNGTTIAGISGILGNNSTMLYYPVSMILDNQLNLYVTDSFNQRIQKFSRY